MTGPALTGLEGSPGEIVPLRLPVPARIFERRAARFRALASGHAAADYLLALASLAEAQDRACREVSIVLEGRVRAPAVPLHPLEWRRGPAWREVLGVILSSMGKVHLPGPARAALDRLAATVPADLEAIADAILVGAFDRIDLAAGPFVAGALQVYWTTLAAGLRVGEVARSEDGCPVCGSPSVAAVILGDDRLRYLVCSLCAAEWHLTRVMCSHCRATDGISYFSVEGDPGAAKAEACQRCRTYLKLFYVERRPAAEPFADDVATLSLDLLMAEEGYARSGVNLFLLPRVPP